MVLHEVNQAEITLLVILGSILMILGIFGFIYMTIAYRRVGIAAKKIDYLVEDLTYKSELLTPAVDALAKFANYSDLIEGILSQNTEQISKFIMNNRESTHTFLNKLREAVKGTK